MISTLSFSKRLLLLFAATATLASCKDTSYLDIDAAKRPPLSAYISFVNARPVNSALSFWTFTDKITPTPVAVNKASDYYPTVFGNVQINFTEGTNTSYKASYQFGNSATFTATGRPNGPIATFYHTVIAARTENNKSDSLILFYDDLKAPEAGKAKLRFVNLSPGAGTLNVLSNGKALFSNVAYGRAANSALSGEAFSAWSLGPFQSINPGPHALTLSNTANGTTLGAVGNFNLEAGKIYTVFTSGLVQGSPNLAFNILEHPVK
ncbi:DUF4397 domain-containing protein [Dyadobacter chenhuakuii]|uniref:DUF4397 domain-containing protein n=1 Tax=Dyadobacter chenhuakuii TaxID=2909339 RepID=A0ABY4XQZ5_9BACT|nr:DUF4397 domain-containing protein [Dyadobacter chenhuakuii]MCF2492852.1 DUF4397 domain-containing protein [Dyadobacter chenhuakuii]USJ32858.1 DUF4397 domain-containing protein [Dyadobacter chenhuakuii]